MNANLEALMKANSIALGRFKQGETSLPKLRADMRSQEAREMARLGRSVISPVIPDSSAAPGRKVENIAEAPESRLTPDAKARLAAFLQASEDLQDFVKNLSPSEHRHIRAQLLGWSPWRSFIEEIRAWWEMVAETPYVRAERAQEAREPAGVRWLTLSSWGRAWRTARGEASLAWGELRTAARRTHEASPLGLIWRQLVDDVCLPWKDWRER
jgi:hypothetical protein